MDLSLIAAGGIDWAWWGYLAQGILALGLVILIHEFGHFAAAKLCGVKVEKFYIGFDFFGLRLFRFRRGETEYGIGVFPLGGYVYMLGQTDNPAKQAEEAQRAKAEAAAGLPIDAEAAAASAIVWDPRSYPAQSVPKRMLIISAGVILNALTAFLFAMGAYLRGVDFTPTTVTSTAPGSPAWEAGLQAGDAIVRIDGISEPRFEADLRSRVALADLQKGLDLRIRRGAKEFDLTIKPRKLRDDFPPTLGVAGPKLTQLAKMRNDRPPTEEGSPARAATPKFQAGDKILKIGVYAIQDYADVVRAQTLTADRKTTITIERTEQPEPGAVKTSRLSIDVEPRPLRVLGLTMEIGPIASVQNDSPAATAGLKPGDKLKSIDAEPVGDPLTLAERLRRKQHAAAGKAWKIVVERSAGGKSQEVAVDVVPREADYFESPTLPGTPLSAPTLGVAFSVQPVVAAVDADGPAAKAGVKPGDVFTHFKTVPGDEASDDGRTETAVNLKLTENDRNNWPIVAAEVLQQIGRTTKVELTTSDDRKLTLEPVDSKEFFNPQRGFLFETPQFTRKAGGFGQAMNYAWYDTRDAMTQVYRFLHALFIGQIPAKALGGVIEIASQAGASASVGFSHLLLFLMMLSANLAVLNFLPFPVLDGGHMVFLLYEGIFRRPPPERLVTALSLIGFVCLVGLMIFALTNDILRRL